MTNSYNSPSNSLDFSWTFFLLLVFKCIIFKRYVDIGIQSSSGQNFQQDEKEDGTSQGWTRHMRGREGRRRRRRQDTSYGRKGGSRGEDRTRHNLSWLCLFLLLLPVTGEERMGGEDRHAVGRRNHKSERGGQQGRRYEGERGRGENCSGKEKEKYICKSDEGKGEASAVNREGRK